MKSGNFLTNISSFLSLAVILSGAFNQSVSAGFNRQNKLAAELSAMTFNQSGGLVLPQPLAIPAPTISPPSAAPSSPAPSAAPSPAPSAAPSSAPVTTQSEVASGPSLEEKKIE